MNNKFETVVFWSKQTEEEILPVFPVELGKSEDSAEEWAKKRGRYDLVKHNFTYTIDGVREELDNLFESVVIDSLKVRGNGGRAYKVILEKNGKRYMVDLRENTLMDVINNAGIEKGGKLNGKFMFIKEGSQTNLVRIGSEAHKTFISARERRSMAREKLISLKDLKEGFIYEEANGKKFIYLGRIYTPDLSAIMRRNYFNSGWGYPEIEFKGVKSTRLFIEYGKSSFISLDDIERREKEGGELSYHLLGTEEKTSPKFIRECGKAEDSVEEIVNISHQRTKQYFIKTYIEGNRSYIHEDSIKTYMKQLCMSVNRDKEEVKNNIVGFMKNLKGDLKIEIKGLEVE